jgi:prophage tail gpP-like protein
MSEQAPNLYEKTQKIPDAVTLFVNGKVVEGWEDFSFTKEINSAASEFSLQLVDQSREQRKNLFVQAGDAIHLHVGKKSLCTGYVEKLDLSMASNSRRFVISGRSRTCDLVDCSVTGANEYSGLTLKEIAEKLFPPFRVRPLFFVNAGAPFDKITIQQGETVFALIDRLARQRKLIIYPDAEGNLIFTRAGGKRSKTELRQGVNVQTGNASYDYTDRFSEYTVKGQNLSFLGDVGQSTAATGSAKDAGVSRFRPFVIVPEGTSDDGTSANRASYEASVRRARSINVEVEVQGFFQADGTLWDVNQIVACDIGFLGVRRDLMIKKIAFQKGAGTRSVLTLCPVSAFDFKPEQKKEGAVGWLKEGFNREG